MRTDLRAIVLALAAAILVAPSGASARDVKRCGITIRAGQTGTLVKDIQCDYRCAANPTVVCIREEPGDDPTCPIEGERYNCDPDAITLERNATLDLNGFTFRPAYHEPKGIVCKPGSRGRCTIVGPGIIYGGKDRSIEANEMDLVLKNLTVARMYKQIIVNQKLILENVELRQLVGFHGTKGVRARNVTIDSDSGLGSGKDFLADGVVSDGYIGAAGTMRVRNSTVKFRSGVEGRDVFLSDTAVVPDAGLEAEVAFEVRAERRLVLRRSTARGIKAGKEPKLIDSGCLKSTQADDVSTWGVCSND